MDTNYIENNTLRTKITNRGGGIEIDLSALGYEGERMSAYQNYLGGGMLGRVASDCTISNWRDNEELAEVSETLKKYFHAITNPDSEWESTSYEQNQGMNVSAY